MAGHDWTWGTTARFRLKNAEYLGFGALNTVSTHLDAKVTVGFIIGDVPNEPTFNAGAAMEMLRLGLPNQNNHEFRFFSDYTAEQILQLAKLTQMDIVAFPFREVSLFDRFFDNEVTRTLVLKSEVPVLVF